MIHPRWYPDHTRTQWRPPEPGALVASDHAVWRIVDVQPQAVILRPVRLKDTDPRGETDYVVSGRGYWHVYIDEHYPVCVQCGEPTPCRERVGERVAVAEMAEMARYETPGVCPACCEPVSRRQKSQTYPVNTKIPGGPPVTFHTGRRSCAYEAAAYAKTCPASAPADLFGGAV